MGSSPGTMTDSFHHGRLKFTAQGSRFNFTIKGPKLWGAQTTGFIEMDFDAGEAGPPMLPAPMPGAPADRVRIPTLRGCATPCSA